MIIGPGPAVPMFNSGYQLPLFMVTNLGPNWEGLLSAVSHGHEVGNYRVSRADLSALAFGQQAQVISKFNQYKYHKSEMYNFGLAVM